MWLTILLNLTLQELVGRERARSSFVPQLQLLPPATHRECASGERAEVTWILNRLSVLFWQIASQVSDPQRRPCSRHLCEGQPEQSHQGYQGREFPWNDPEKWPWKMALKNDPEKWPRKWPWKLILGEEEQCGEKQLLSPVQPVLPLQVAGGAAGHLLPQHLSLWGGIYMRHFLRWTSESWRYFISVHKSDDKGQGVGHLCLGRLHVSSVLLPILPFVKRS